MGTTCTVASSLSEATLLKRASEPRLTSFIGCRASTLTLNESFWTRSYAYGLTAYDEWSGRLWYIYQRLSAHESFLSGTNRRSEPDDCCFSPVTSSGHSDPSITSGRYLLLHFPVDLVACSCIGVPGINTEFPGCSLSCLILCQP